MAAEYEIYSIILLMSVCRCSQTAGGNSCSIVSGDVSNCSYRLALWQYILSRVRVSVRPRFFYMPKTPKTSGTWAASASVYFNGQRPVLSPAEWAVAVGSQRIDITCMAAAAVCVSVCVCVRVGMRA